MPTFDSHANFAYGIVVTPPSPTSSGTTLTLGSGQGALFPTPPFNVILSPVGALPLFSTAEIARVTAISGNVLTITRAVEGTSAQSVSAGWQVYAGPTAKSFTDIETQISSSGAFTPTGDLTGSPSNIVVSTVGGGKTPLTLPTNAAAQDLLIISSGVAARVPVGAHGYGLVVRSDGTVNYADPAVVYASAWGAVFDGTTDTSAAVQAAINAVPATGGKVKLPAGIGMLGTGLTFPTSTITNGEYETSITLEGAGAGTTTLRKKNDVILIDNSGTIASGAVTMRRGVKLRELTLDGNNLGSQPLLRCYYAYKSEFDKVWFYNNAGGSAVVGVQFWDSYFTDCWFNYCGGSTPTIDQSYNSGTSVNGNECVRLLSCQQWPQVGTSTMGYSTDNTNNIWFTNTEWTNCGAGALYVGANNSPGGSPHRLYFVNSKFEDSAMQGPFIRAFGMEFSSFKNVNFNAIACKTGITSIDMVHLANTVHVSFDDIFAEADGTYTAARVFNLFGGCDNVRIGTIYPEMTIGGSGGVAPYNITGRTTSGANAFASLIDFQGISAATNTKIRQPKGGLGALTIRSLPADAVITDSDIGNVLVNSVTNATGTAAAVLNPIHMDSYETWDIEWNLTVAAGSAGLVITNSAPTGTTGGGTIFGQTTNASSYFGEMFNPNTAGGGTYAQTNGQINIIKIHATFTAGATAGNVQLAYGPRTVGQTATVYYGSSMKARRIA